MSKKNKEKKLKSAQANILYKLPDILREASTYFNLGQIVTCKMVTGNINKNYSITTESGNSYILKIIIKHNIEDLKTEIIYMDRLRKYDFPAAYYVSNIHGSSIFQYKNIIVMLQPKLKGLVPSFTADVCLSVGHNLARLHQIPIIDLPEREHWLKRSFLEKNILLIQNHLPDKSQQFKDAYDLLYSFEYLNLTKTIIHGDLYENNCLYEGGDLVAILDWEEVGIAPGILDLATCVFNFCFENNIFHPELYKIMVDEYQLMRPLNKLERRSMNLALKYVALNLCAWRLVKFNIYGHDPSIVKKSRIYWDTELDKLQLPII